MVHGSSIFERGDTQAMVITTLGPTKEAQDMDGLTGGATSKSFMLHYNFPPFSVGETGRFGAPGRREVGHGALAERSLDPRRLRDHGLQRLDLDGVDLRRMPVPDGRGRPDHRPGRGNLLRPDDRQRPGRLDRE